MSLRENSMNESAPTAAIDVVIMFNQAFNAHDVDAVMALMTDDCVFDGTMPPDGDRHDGAAQVRRAWEDLFLSSPSAHFTTEELLAVGDRVVCRWRFDWIDGDGTSGHVRGIDLFRVSDGRVAEKLSYVKG